MVTSIGVGPLTNVGGVINNSQITQRLPLENYSEAQNKRVEENTSEYGVPSSKSNDTSDIVSIQLVQKTEESYAPYDRYRSRSSVDASTANSPESDRLNMMGRLTNSPPPIVDDKESDMDNDTPEENEFNYDVEKDAGDNVQRLIDAAKDTMKYISYIGQGDN